MLLTLSLRFLSLVSEGKCNTEPTDGIAGNVWTSLSSIPLTIRCT